MNSSTITPMNKRLMNNNLNLSANWQKFVAETRHTSDRSLTILGATYLKDHLGRLLACFMIPDENIFPLLLGNEKPLGTFSARIQAVYSLGLIGPNEYHDLLLILDIHNAFVDNFDSMSFNNDKIRQHCQALRAPRQVTHPEETFTPRRMFEFAIALLARQLTLRAAQAEKEQRSVRKNFMLVDADN